MGQKVNPHGIRVGVIKGWDSVWYADRNFGDYLVEDDRIRKFIKKKLFAAGISRITIHRTSAKCNVTIHTARPGVVIGRSGQAIGELTLDVQKMLKVNPEQRAHVYIEEVRMPELNAQLVAEDIAKQLENRVTFRRAMRGAMTKTMKMGALGIKTATSGRLGGADIARTESYHEGTIPLQTLRADIDYGFAEANTAAGKLGVKVWIYRGEIFSRKDGERKEPPRPPREMKRGDRGDRGRRPDRPRGQGQGGPGQGRRPDNRPRPERSAQQGQPRQARSDS
ncbi:MAG: 30S ribosomal protein S3 [Defluviitaleaceae bacterium]|nr:30S ribosomal protein S3 [Defluviitaleaceae bacterium]MCL2836681.1 30S ribosomal protein S3 [Defluviitaleaceae bacterium]